MLDYFAGSISIQKNQSSFKVIFGDQHGSPFLFFEIFHQYNGNISSIQWQSGGDKTERSYSYTYDAVNRLLAADFNQKFSSGWGKSDGSFTIDYSVKMGDGINPTTAYDENGNIKQMQQWGLKLNTSVQIDNLAYNYYANSNKLKNIIDANNDTATTLGDFRSSKAYMVALGNNKTSAAIDYTYDSSGNAIKDLNKDIGDANVAGIEYNQFNLPWKITVKNKGTITYIYDAAGNKLEKITKEPASSINQNVAKEVHTTYLKGYIYVNNQLTLFGHEEGRIRANPANGGATSFVYDYFLKDHLGNIRTVLTDEQKVDAYPAATMELAHAATDTALFSNLENTRSDKPPGYPTDTTYSNLNNKVAKLDGTNNKIGPGITLKVMAGDKFNIRVSSWYRKGTVTPVNPANPLTDLLAALASSVSGAATTGHGAMTATALNNSGVIPPGATQFLNNQTYTSGKPKAFLNWLVFDEHFKYDSASSGFEQVGDDTILTIHTRTDLTVNKNGYLYVYVSNVTGNIPVFFDNLQVTHTRGPLLEEDHYYPFGLQMKGICSRAAGGVENKFKFNQGTELNSDFDLSIYETPLRPYDPQTGRFTGIDILCEKRVWLSTYQFGRSNPIAFNDPSGALEGYAADVWNDLVAHVSSRKSINDIEIGGQPVDFFFFGSSGGGGGGGLTYGTFGGNSFNEVYSGLRNMGHEPPITAGLVRSMMESQGNYSYAAGLQFQNNVTNANGGFNIHYGSDYQLNVSGELANNSYFRSTENIKGELDFIYGLYKDDGSNVLQTTNVISGAFDVGSGAKAELIDYAAAEYTGTAMKNLERADYVAAFGKNGANYVRGLKVLGGVTFAASAFITGVQTYDYYHDGGTSASVGIKAGLDVAMGVVGFLGPVGFGISAVYFLFDAAGGFGSWGDPTKTR